MQTYFWFLCCCLGCLFFLSSGGLLDAVTSPPAMHLLGILHGLLITPES